MISLDDTKKALQKEVESCTVSPFLERVGLPFFQGRLSVVVRQQSIDLGICRVSKPDTLYNKLKSIPGVQKVWFDIGVATSDFKKHRYKARLVD